MKRGKSSKGALASTPNFNNSICFYLEEDFHAEAAKQILIL
jgi:hypothetical protein